MSKRAVITGASSGIGEALARELARRGWSLALLARRSDRIEALARELGNAVAFPCDVTDRTAVADSVRKAVASLGGAFDLAVANAGIGAPTHASKFKAEEAEQMVRVNVLGVMNLFDAVIPSMIEGRSGRFAGVASLAGLRGLPTSSVYSATKAAVQAFLESSRIELAPYGVGVTTINPGFVATAMTERNRFRMPFLMNVERAAVIIGNGLERGSRVIQFPLPMSLGMRLMRLLPNAIYDRMMTPYGRRKTDPPGVKR